MEEADGTRWEWDYDNAYRLLSEERLSPSNSLLSSSAYVYDGAGNRLSQTVNGVETSFTYDIVDQLLTSTTAGITTEYTYDARGNTTSVSDATGTTNYLWDAQNRLTGVNLPDATVVEYTYDADGRRVSQQIDGLELNYLWDSQSPYGDVVSEYDEAAQSEVEYTLANGLLISQSRQGDTSFYHADGQRSIRALSDESGTLLSSYDYSTYGEILDQAGNTANNYLYTGQQYDELTGQYSLRARYYDPSLGRFASRDTYAYNYHNPIEVNRYGYTANNPVNRYDPTGQSLIETAVDTINNFVESRIGIASITGFLTGMLGSYLTYLMASTGQCGQEAQEWTYRVNPIEFVLYSAGIGALSSSVFEVGGKGVGLAFTALGTYTAAHTDGEGFVRGVEFTICNLMALLSESVKAIVDSSNDQWASAAAFGAVANSAAGTTTTVGAGGATGSFLGVTSGLLGGLIGIVAGAVLATDMCPPGQRFNPETEQCEDDNWVLVSHYTSLENALLIQTEQIIRPREWYVYVFLGKVSKSIARNSGAQQHDSRVTFWANPRYLEQDPEQTQRKGTPDYVPEAKRFTKAGPIAIDGKIYARGPITVESAGWFGWNTVE